MVTSRRNGYLQTGCDAGINGGSMKRQVARQIADVMKKMDDLFLEIDGLLGDIEDRNERKAIARGLAELVCHAHEKITLVVANQYPEMHPDNVKGGWTYQPHASSSKGRR